MTDPIPRPEFPSSEDAQAAGALIDRALRLAENGGLTPEQAARMLAASAGTVDRVLAGWAASVEAAQRVEAERDHLRAQLTAIEAVLNDPQAQVSALGASPLLDRVRATAIDHQRLAAR